VEINFSVRKPSRVSNAFPVITGDELKDFSVRGPIEIPSALAQHSFSLKIPCWTRQHR